jgi:hypothetical protein
MSDVPLHKTETVFDRDYVVGYRLRVESGWIYVFREPEATVFVPDKPPCATSPTTS